MVLHKGNVVISLMLLEIYLIFQMHAPKSYCREVVLIATYLINSLPFCVFDGVNLVWLMTIFYLSIPIMISFKTRVFRCFASVHFHSPRGGKLDHGVVKCIFIGYTLETKRDTNVIISIFVVSMYQTS